MFCKMWKVIVFCPFFGQILLDVQKHYKIGISAHFQKQKKEKNDHFEGLLSGPSKGYYLGQVCCNIKMANLAHIITLQMAKLGPDNNSTIYIYMYMEEASFSAYLCVLSWKPEGDVSKRIVLPVLFEHVILLSRKRILSLLFSD